MLFFFRSHVSLFLPFADGEVTHPLEINTVTLMGMRLLYAIICSIKTLTNYSLHELFVKTRAWLDKNSEDCTKKVVNRKNGGNIARL